MKSSVCTLLFFLFLFFGSAGVAMGNQIGKGKTGGVVIKVKAMPLEDREVQVVQGNSRAAEHESSCDSTLGYAAIPRNQNRWDAARSMQDSL